ncbi:protein-tyrosine phosphatase-like protein [Mycena maculata]|uniref:protein-tyrosine-phosphatase n=1 Tax=Mycena maculata TaxID=230809 RepID=A0AAD7I756_9AGAR|nr:protein-tyrosine phosphatase-like protein [Mycena maculata]
MITFDSVPPEEMEAMCTPMHRVLSPTTTTPQNKPTTTGSDEKETPRVGAHETSSVSTGALYLGSIAAMHDSDLLHAHDITHLVQVLEVPWLPQDEATAGFKCYRIDVEDRSSATLRPHLAGACDYIRTALDQGESVLVHCQHGVSRSASIVLAYLIRDRVMTYDAAFDLVHARRRCIRPNSGFVRALREWEIECKTNQIPGGAPPR